MINHSRTVSVVFLEQIVAWHQKGAIRMSMTIHHEIDSKRAVGAFFESGAGL